MQTTGVMDSGAANTYAAIANRSLDQQLDRNAFLSLLVTQMRSQDPMKPMEDKEFIAQLAQFSALEQMQQVSAKMDLVAMGILSSSASSLLGHTVTAQTPDDAAPFSGRVDAITYVDGAPQLVIGDRTVEPQWVMRVE